MKNSLNNVISDIMTNIAIMHDALIWVEDYTKLEDHSS